ncbi:MAG: porin [Acidobacteriota bacterium]|nr:porin [Acidobacteriota bacterium]
MNRRKHDDPLLFVCLVILLLLAATSKAQDAPPPIAFSGFVDLNFSWNSNRPDNHQNFYPGAGTSAKRANEFAINLAQVQWTRPVSAEQPVGFTLALVAGEGAGVVHGGEPEGAGTFRHIYHASVAYRLANGVVLEGGIYPSHIGLEGFYAKDNWNYTRSIMGESSPYYQTGIKASYAFNDRWSGRVDLLNGWQLINDNNSGKSIGAQIAYSRDAWTASLNSYLGPELANDDDSLRKFVDLVVLYKATPSLQLGGTVDIGSQDIPNTDDANWNGVGVYARYAIDERNAIAVRAERFSDPDNGITGAAQTVREATLTYESRPHENVILKLEGRYDQSSTGVFFKNDTTTDRQFLALAGVVVMF